jgi:plasmid stability protein
MLVCMRTTLNLDEGLMRALKRRAAETGRTMTEMVEEAVRELLAREDEGSQVEEFRFLTVRGRRRPAVDIADRDAILDVMEGRR